MKCSIIGGGGREHALAWKSRSRPGRQVYVAPGNAGTAREAKCENVAIGAEDVAALALRARTTSPHHRRPRGAAGAGRGRRLPRRRAAMLRPPAGRRATRRLQGLRQGFSRAPRIPTAAYGNFTEIDPAIAYITKMGAPIVVKADGLAAGKGVIVARTVARRSPRCATCWPATPSARRRARGDRGIPHRRGGQLHRHGRRRARAALATSQDHKARGDGDTGPNTGGMGAYSPAPVVTPAVHARIMREVIEPTVRGMAAEGIPTPAFSTPAS
jgi:phosphoribosylamine---glycine ligase